MVGVTVGKEAKQWVFYKMVPEKVDAKLLQQFRVNPDMYHKQFYSRDGPRVPRVRDSSFILHFSVTSSASTLDLMSDITTSTYCSAPFPANLFLRQLKKWRPPRLDMNVDELRTKIHLELLPTQSVDEVV